MTNKTDGAALSVTFKVTLQCGWTRTSEASSEYHAVQPQNTRPVTSFARSDAKWRCFVLRRPLFLEMHYVIRVTWPHMTRAFCAPSSWTSLTTSEHPSRDRLFRSTNVVYMTSRDWRALRGDGTRSSWKQRVIHTIRLLNHIITRLHIRY